jgi:hypothetical protein
VLEDFTKYSLGQATGRYRYSEPYTVVWCFGPSGERFRTPAIRLVSSHASVWPGTSSCAGANRVSGEYYIDVSSPWARQYGASTERAFGFKPER